MKAATTTTAGPAMIIHTMPNDHHGLACAVPVVDEFKVLVFMVICFLWRLNRSRALNLTRN
jgi:hypothetical protein